MINGNNYNNNMYYNLYKHTPYKHIGIGTIKITRQHTILV